MTLPAGTLLDEPDDERFGVPVVVAVVHSDGGDNRQNDVGNRHRRQEDDPDAGQQEDCRDDAVDRAW